MSSGSPEESLLPHPLASPVPLLVAPELFRRLRELPDHESRRAFLAKEGEKTSSPFFPRGEQGGDYLYRRGRGLRFQWQAPDSMPGPYQVELSEERDFRRFRIFRANKIWARHRWETFVELKEYEANLKVGTQYYWRVRFVPLPPTQAPETLSPVSRFVTEDLPPRIISREKLFAVDGRVANSRDVGGWRTRDGRRVRQGMAYRMEAFDEPSPDTIHPGRNRLALADREFFLETLGIRTDLDLRTPAEAGQAGISPLGPRVRYHNLPVEGYEVACTPEQREATGAVFHLLADPRAYPLVFHCLGGADRTGMVAFLLNGLLGVPENDLCLDWETTFLPHLPCEEYHCAFRCCQRLLEPLKEFGRPEDPLDRKIHAFLLTCGVTPRELQRIKDIFLE
ncbi:MAG: tyrosine-protein phosphatase [Oligosphaeraceae bacterium]